MKWGLHIHFMSLILHAFKSICHNYIVKFEITKQLKYRPVIQPSDWFTSVRHAAHHVCDVSATPDHASIMHMAELGLWRTFLE